MSIQRLTLKRLPDWEARLDAAIEASRLKTWKRGDHDCFFFTMNCVEAVTGIDPGKEWRGKYTTLEGANKLLAAEGVPSIIKFMKARFGAPVAPAMARRGDVVFARVNKSAFAGICVGRYAAFAQKPLMFLPIEHVSLAWRIG